MKMILSLIMLCFTISPTKAQTRILLGGHGGQEYSNTTLGVLAGIERPVGRRLEFDLTDEFSPYENHTGLGTGSANRARLQGIGWLTGSFGLTGSLQHDEYSVSIHKDSFKALGGVLFRHVWAGSPTRLEFDYIHTVLGHFKHGLDAEYLQGGRVAVTTRLGCHGVICYRLGWEMQAGKVLLQGNPVCDGSLPGPVTCPRQSVVSGGAKAYFTMEFPRRRNTEDEAF